MGKLEGVAVERIGAERTTASGDNRSQKGMTRSQGLAAVGERGCKTARGRKRSRGTRHCLARLCRNIRTTTDARPMDQHPRAVGTNAGRIEQQHSVGEASSSGSGDHVSDRPMYRHESVHTRPRAVGCMIQAASGGSIMENSHSDRAREVVGHRSEQGVREG